MREGFKALKNDPLSLGALFLNFGFLTLSLLFLIVNFSHLPPQIPLFYSRSWGERQLANREELFLLPSLSLLILLLNLLLAQKIYFREPVFFRILIWAATLFTLLSTWALYQNLRIIT